MNLLGGPRQRPGLPGLRPDYWRTETEPGFTRAQVRLLEGQDRGRLAGLRPDYWRPETEPGVPGLRADYWRTETEARLRASGPIIGGPRQKRALARFRPDYWSEAINGPARAVGAHCEGGWPRQSRASALLRPDIPIAWSRLQAAITGRLRPAVPTWRADGRDRARGTRAQAICPDYWSVAINGRNGRRCLSVRVWSRDRARGTRAQAPHPDCWSRQGRRLPAGNPPAVPTWRAMGRDRAGFTRLRPMVPITGAKRLTAACGRRCPFGGSGPRQSPGLPGLRP